jgi:hypothetical protein
MTLYLTQLVCSFIDNHCVRTHCPDMVDTTSKMPILLYYITCFTTRMLVRYVVDAISMDCRNLLLVVPLPLLFCLQFTADVVVQVLLVLVGAA